MRWGPTLFLIGLALAYVLGLGVGSAFFTPGPTTQDLTPHHTNNWRNQ